MKKKFKVALLGLAVAGTLTVTTIFVSDQTSASITPEKEIEQTFDAYISAIKSGNADDMVKYTKDLRFEDVNIQNENYKKLPKDDVISTKVLSVKKEDDTHYLLSVDTKTKSAGKVQRLFPVIKEGNQWKIVVGQDTPYDPNNFKE
ncbi:DUF4878 domain-containing protein [Paenibacillus sp. Soil787]|uniref:DUF4878 domain-containing protein n=1 Tax=Paenibacillus sp. Soil787 TaxID=1736411 RepID=UPI0006F3DCD2|nr:DUF4878 domain-containing protein [Paenibacillus sp. Soil787]KRF44012.1 hypothetical protein ASG93_03640 [Paenibacillus sp. Soil787]